MSLQEGVELTSVFVGCASRGSWAEQGATTSGKDLHKGSRKRGVMVEEAEEGVCDCRGSGKICKR